MDVPRISNYLKELDIEELSVLDLGCGVYDSPLSVQLTRLPFKKLTSLDINYKVINILMGKLFAAKVHHVISQDAIEWLSVQKDESFDVVIGLDLLQNVHSAFAAGIINHAMRVTKRKVIFWTTTEAFDKDEAGGFGFEVEYFPKFHKHRDPPLDAMMITYNKKIIETILVERLDVHGDVLIATSVLPGLRKKFPDAKIDFLVRDGFDFSLAFNPYIDNIIKTKKPGVFDKSPYDLHISLDHHRQWNDQTARVHCRIAEVPFNPPNLHFKSHEINAVPEGLRGKVLIALKAGWRSRTCPNLAAALQSIPNLVQVDKGDPLPGVTQFRKTLREVAALMYHAKLYIGVDTVFMHMAVACGIPMVLMMGPTGVESQYIPNATVAKPLVHTKPAKSNKKFAQGIDLPVKTIITAIRTRLTEDGDIVSKKPRRKMIYYTY